MHKEIIEENQGLRVSESTQSVSGGTTAPGEKCPLISIIIPVYNVAPYIREAVESAVNQTYKNLEIILIDGRIGSDF